MNGKSGKNGFSAVGSLFPDSLLGSKGIVSSFANRVDALLQANERNTFKKNRP
jgi:hypothetical protein